MKNFTIYASLIATSAALFLWAPKTPGAAKIAQAAEKEHSKDGHEHDDTRGEADHRHAAPQEPKGHERESDENHEHGHDHDEDGGGKGDHAEDHEHGEGEEEESPSVGPDKGIVEASEDRGIKLSPEALKNFELKMTKLSGSSPWKLPLSARLLAGEEVNLYRHRDGFFKRIDFTAVASTSSEVTVRSSELNSGDEIVIGGIGFLRIAELAAFGGVAHGHSH